MTETPTTASPRPLRRWLVPGTLMALCVVLLVTWLFVLRPAVAHSAISPDDLVGADVPRDGSADIVVAEVGKSAPATTLTTFDGRTLDLSSLRGKPVVLNFWASSCAPCIKEMPLIERVHQRLGAAVTIVGVDAFETPDLGQPMIDRTGATYTQTTDPTNLVLSRFGGTQLPHTVIISPDGTVAALHNTSITDDQVLLDLIDRAAS